MRVDQSLIVAALWLGLAAAPPEDIPLPGPRWPARELAIRSGMIVVAAPAPPDAGRFKVLRVLMGSGLKEGDLFQVDDLSLYDLQAHAPELAPGPKPGPIRIEEVLFFFKPPEKYETIKDLHMTDSGLRLLTRDGGVCYPEPEGYGRYSLRPYRIPVRWQELVRKVGADSSEIKHLRYLESIPNAPRRNRALLDWAEARRSDFGGGLSLEDGSEPTVGWGSAEQDLFNRVFADAEPAVCWQAVELYGELNHGDAPVPYEPFFASRAMRDLLLKVARDDDALVGNRVRALDLLASTHTLWPSSYHEDRCRRPMGLTEEEQAALIDAEVPLLKATNSSLRRAAAQALFEVCWPPAWASGRTQRTLPALTAAYKEERPGPTRDALAEAVIVIGGPKRWMELTGNAHGVLAVMNDPGCRQGAEVFCWLYVQESLEAIPSEPTLLLERLDGQEKIVEKKEQPLGSSLNAWKYHMVGYFTFSMTNYTPGLWRMTIKGLAGKDKAPWTSEPRLLRLAPPPKADQPNIDTKAPRIVFDP